MSSELVTTELPEYIRRYLNGDSMQVIARDMGIHRATLYRHMMRDLGDDHADTVTDMLVQRIADADERLESAVDQCDIARAREMARFARMDFERRRPSLYGQKAATNVNVAGNNVTVAIVSYDQPSIADTDGR